MKILASYVVEPYYQKNIVFDEIKNKTFFEGRTQKHIEIKKEFEKYSVCLNTNDINSIADSDIVIYNDMPKVLPKKEAKHKSYLIIHEPPSVLQANFDVNKLNRFRKIFTWDDNMVDNKVFVKYNFSFDLTSDFSKNILFKQKKFACVIAANKFSSHKYEAYSKRKEIINWFVKNQLELDLYGYDWDKFIFKKYPFTFLNRIKIITKSLGRYLNMSNQVYKGTLKSKFDVLGDYKFCFCFENIYNVSGYISEKIFDCFFSATIPIYLGAENIGDFIPKNTFIDYRDYSTIDELYNYLSSMNEIEFSKYISNAKQFLKSNESNIFDSTYNAKIIVRNILDEN